MMAPRQRCLSPLLANLLFKNDLPEVWLVVDQCQDGFLEPLDIDLSLLGIHGDMTVEVDGAPTVTPPVQIILLNLHRFSPGLMNKPDEFFFPRSQRTS